MASWWKGWNKMGKERHLLEGSYNSHTKWCKGLHWWPRIPNGIEYNHVPRWTYLDNSCDLVHCMSFGFAKACAWLGSSLVTDIILVGSSVSILQQYDFINPSKRVKRLHYFKLGINVDVFDFLANNSYNQRSLDGLPISLHPMLLPSV